MTSNKTVCVTGASGYIATELIKQLLDKGYTVHGTVRNLTDDNKVKHLKDLFPTLKLFEADLLKEGSFDKAIEGVSYVAHVASPFQTSVEDPQKDLIDPAVSGTKNVLASVAKFNTVKRVVVTSSVAAIASETPKEGQVFSETDWNTTSTIENNPYRLSKTLAEKEVWAWAEQHPKVGVVTILPAFVVGPPLSDRTDATSIKIIKALLDGTDKKNGGTAPAAFAVVDVRDVAKAHVEALEKEQASGRYLVCTTYGVPRIEMANALRKEFPDWPIPEQTKGEIKVVPKQNVDRTLNHLGFTFDHPSPEKSVVEMAKKLVELGVVTKPQ